MEMEQLGLPQGLTGGHGCGQLNTLRHNVSPVSYYIESILRFSRVPSAGALSSCSTEGPLEKEWEDL